MNPLSSPAASYLVAAMLLFTATPALAADDPELERLLKSGADAVLAESDRRLTNWEDQTLRVQMDGVGPGETKRLELTVITKGGDRRALRFREPADMRGMGVVIKGMDEIYVRLPGSSKTRRVAAHARKQGLPGTDWAFDDSALIRLSPFYTAKTTGKTDTHLKLELTRRPGANIGYEKLEVEVARASVTVDLVRYIGDDGKPLKEEKRTALKTWDGKRTYQQVKVTNLRKEHSTAIKVLEEKNDTGVKKKTFSKRWLVRGI